MQKKADLNELLHKYHHGTCNSEELALLETWYAQHIPSDHEIAEEELLEAKSDVWQNLKSSLNFSRETVRLWSRISAAAILFISFSVGILLHFKQDPGKAPNKAQNKFAKNDIPPGGNKAYLTLANGKKITLTDAGIGTLAKESGIEISKNAEGHIVYKIADQAGNSKGALTAMNSIETPKGGQYQVILPDGTKVWLNAASRITYPVSFVNRDRTVELVGEAYFEVAKDAAHPFKVKNSGQFIEVLGTHFNVNSYADESNIRTSLMEGSVKVSVSSGKGVLLKPGQQSTVAPGKEIQVAEVNVDDVLDWKNGNFVFNDEDLRSVLRKVARWYDVEIVYEINPSEVSLLGVVSRSKNVSSILDAIEQTEQVHFKIEGRRIIVMK
ncbi:FecR family protein [Pedobacter gandavensis]|uniref:FecR family protein n=1 Tax=Pedobacter gandavensis TaxID=2679963 RepID=UPI002931774C|nr:FecR domain-containing protein [Pedobacter gandavensis]